MKKHRQFLLLFPLLASQVLAQTFGGPLTPTVAIPDGAQGPCAVGSTPAVVTVVVPPGLPNIANIAMTTGIFHTWYGDVRCDVMGPTGVMVSLLGPGAVCNGFGDASDLIGLYTFDDSALVTIDSAATLAGASLPTGTYQADNPLNAAFAGTNPSGTWTFTFSDIALNDTGTVSHVSLTINCQSESYSIVQPGGPGSPVTFLNTGCSGESFLRILALGPSGVPTGWFYGMNLPFPQIVAEINFGYPFVGSFPPAGVDAFALPPNFFVPGTVLASCGFHFDQSGFPVLIVPAFNYTVQ